MSTKDLKEKGTHFLLLTGSTLLMAVGTYFFKFTNNFTFGGITGLAVLIAKTGVMSAGDFNLIASMILLLMNDHTWQKICRRNCLLQHPAFRHALSSGTDLSHDPAADGSAYA